LSKKKIYIKEVGERRSPGGDPPLSYSHFPPSNTQEEEEEEEEEEEDHQGEAQDVRVKEVGVWSSPGGGAPPVAHTPPTIKHSNI
jgi:hypothetical protein